MLTKNTFSFKWLSRMNITCSLRWRSSVHSCIISKGLSVYFIPVVLEEVQPHCVICWPKYEVFKSSITLKLQSDSWLTLITQTPNKQKSLSGSCHSSLPLSPFSLSFPLSVSVPLCLSPPSLTCLILNSYYIQCNILWTNQLID